MKKTIYTFLFTLMLMLSLTATAQEVTKEELPNRWVFGGSIGLGFNNSQTSINVNPQIGYRFTNWFTWGGGFNYAFFKDKDFDDKSNYLGLNTYLRFNPVRYIHLFAQPELFRRWGKTNGVKDKEKVFPTLLLGGGVLIPVIQGGIVISLYYDVIQDKYSPYRDGLMYSLGYTVYF